MESPNHLPESVRKVYVELAAELGDQLDSVAGPEFDAYVTCVTRLRDAQSRIEAEQLIVPDSKNAPVAHPAFAIERQCMDDLRKWGDRFRPKPARKGGAW